ncbi:Bug family tripartite tricarboxylate transporter substrate binding protein [Variovorax paradoxus]|jgi:tripartite-type tricarboxylate transporter receptor subunit TctC|uniref:Bug family tripartite tricarboxylate transporter substrate binding protein n=1 Tax=Variovorax paradoxus TaxID=34073 RepID=UPI002480D889|nr:tripartite tricarboxylate transporter substrate binding protein [Variovorax paradoxus]WGT65779.1 tripartite tricarboxylate transporter substrate binding protein [Variovorax paradoxus]
MFKKTASFAKFVLLGAAFAGAQLCAASEYPNKPIKMVIPYTPGGSIDTVGRMVADQLQRQLGQPIVIENLPGASGVLGSLNVKKAKADGYTLLFNASSQVYMPLVVAKKTYDAEQDFTPVGQIGYVPLLVAVNNDVPAKNLGEFAALVRANPGKYTWATSGLGTTSHLSEEMINRALKLNMEIIAYKGAIPQLTDVVGGHVSAAVSPMPGVRSFVQGARLRAIAITSKTRVASMPDVPTVAESGIPGFELLSWYGIWGPAGMPEAVTNRLNSEIAKAVDTPALKAKFTELSFVPAKSNPEQFRKLIREDLSKIGQAVKEANIRID